MKYIAIAFGVVLAGALSVYTVGKYFGAQTNIGYISARVDNYLRDNKEIAQTKANSPGDHQLRNGFIALGSGGFSGL